MVISEQSSVARFLDEFREQHGRAPRILHLGNIANNAYLNAKILNRAGFDCDVVADDYYHIMGCPEWEECDFDDVVADHFRPDWAKIDLSGYKRPRWFVQGPRELCIRYLTAKRSGDTGRAEKLWRDLSWTNKTLRLDERGASHRLQRQSQVVRDGLRGALATARYYVRRARTSPDGAGRARQKILDWSRAGGLTRRVLGTAATTGLEPAMIVLRAFAPAGIPLGDWAQRFAEAFPERPDKLAPQDYAGYLPDLPDWKKLFVHYDIVQAYATNVVYPMLAEHRPYVGFEHGTLRAFTLGDDPLSRLTALGYHRADHVLITNGDCLEYAHKIRVKAYSPMLHPFDDRFMEGVTEDRDGLRRQYGARRLFLCPLRHDWAIKGTDKYIRALPDLAARLGRDFRVIMTRWGAQVEESRQLAEALGVSDLISWTEPFNRFRLVRHLKSVDVVFDQTALPCFGGTAPQAIYAGVPVIMSYDPSSTAWLIPEPAPILPGWTVDQIVASTVTALDPVWRADYAQEAERWYRLYHSTEEVIRKHADVYRAVFQETGLLPAA